MKFKSKKYPKVGERLKKLAELRHIKMARSSHAYVRGNTQRFYDWLKSAEGVKVPQGPPIWICGDCHLGNLGPIANTKGDIDIQIRDLDQTVIGNPAHDLIRLGLSLASAARGSDLPGVITVKIIEHLMSGYEEAFANADKSNHIQIERPKTVKVAMKAALARKWKHLAQERLEDTKPNIPLGKRFWPLSKIERQQIKALFKEEKVRRLITGLRSRDDNSSITVLDAAFWVKGCSSLGGSRYAVLLRIDGKHSEQCLIDIKQARVALAPHHRKAKMPKDNAERVVQGAWHLSPALGERMLAMPFQGRSVFLRELLPQDLKFEIEYLDPEEAMKVAKFLAAVIGKAHARQMDANIRQVWQKTLAGHRTKTLDAPSWLWAGVTELVVSHEGAYLEHCRKYSLTLPEEKGGR
jgi:uncharacterized protein (DUF2252 family)